MKKSCRLLRRTPYARLPAKPCEALRSLRSRSVTVLQHDNSQASHIIAAMTSLVNTLASNKAVKKVNDSSRNAACHRQTRFRIRRGSRQQFPGDQPPSFPTRQQTYSSFHRFLVRGSEGLTVQSRDGMEAEPGSDSRTTPSNDSNVSRQRCTSSPTNCQVRPRAPLSIPAGVFP